MSFVSRARASFIEIGFALRKPEAFARRWRERDERPEDAPDPIVFVLLLVTAIAGLAAYGVSMGLHLGPSEMLRTGFLAPLAAGSAWMIALPALYVIDGALGSKLDASTTLLVALATVSFASLAMLASVPINWFFTLAMPYGWARYLINGVIFVGVGFCMGDVFLRTMRSLEPNRRLVYPIFWLALLSGIGLELMVLVDLFHF